MLADEVVGLATQVYKQLEATGGTLAAVDDVRHVRGQNERSAVPDGKRRREDFVKKLLKKIVFVEVFS